MDKVKLIITLLSLLFSATLSYSQDLRVMSYNIRYANQSDGPDRWDLRKEELVCFLDSMNLDFVGFQEALFSQVNYLQSNLPDLAYVGEGREGADKGEFCPLFYDRERFELKESNTFWLSVTPDIPSTGWDAAMNRICSYGKFMDRQDSTVIYVFNTHFDHKGELARMESARLIWAKITDFCKVEDEVIVFGDFNLLPDSKPIQYLSEQLQDAYLTEEVSVTGPESTFNGFRQLEAGKRIDYCFLKNLYPIQVWHLNPKRKNGRFLSDHLPVYCEIKKDR